MPRATGNTALWRCHGAEKTARQLRASGSARAVQGESQQVVHRTIVTGMSRPKKFGACHHLAPLNLLGAERRWSEGIPRLSTDGPITFTHSTSGWSRSLDYVINLLDLPTRTTGIRNVQPVALLAREKWGFLNLRFFRLDPADASMLAYVEALSKRVCEVCGGPAQLVQETHLRTRCEAHRDVLPTWPTSAR